MTRASDIRVPSLSFLSENAVMSVGGVLDPPRSSALYLLYFLFFCLDTVRGSSFFLLHTVSFLMYTGPPYEIPLKDRSEASNFGILSEKNLKIRSATSSFSPLSSD